MKKVALVTGSSRGIGRTTARLLAEKGYVVVLHARHADRLEKTRKELADQGFEVYAYPADITDLAQVENLFRQIMSDIGRLDVLITNASLTMEAEFMATEPKAFQQVVDSHIYGTVFPVRVMLEEITKNRGSIILISSLAGLHGLPRFSAYCTGKMALTAFWQTLQMENKNRGLHLGLVHLAFVRNDVDKLLVNARGELESMPPRPAGLQQPQEVVAKGIYRVIRRRKKRVVLSWYGKTMDMLIRFFPRLVHVIISRFFKT